jgi:hypothetical protein
MESTSPKLTDIMKSKYPQDTKSFPDTTSLEAGVIHVTDFRIADSSNYERIAYIDASEGHFRTTSRAIVGSLAGEVGKTIKEALHNAKSVEIEIVKKKANTGRIGLAIKAF